MIIKLFRRGTGRGSGPVDYLLSERDSKGNPRPYSPEILYGEPDRIRRVIDSLDFRHKYTSGVLSFATEDRPTPSQQEQVIREFEDLAFAGLSRDRVQILWVRHTGGDGRVELHFVISKVDLATGKQFNAFPPGWKKDFRDWKNMTNLKNGWADPEDPNRARVRSPAEKESPSRSLEKERLTASLVSKIKGGEISDRAGVIEELKRQGYEIKRLSSEYLSIRKDSTPPLRLKGGIFSESFSLEESEKARSVDRAERLGKSVRGAALARGRRERVNRIRYETQTEAENRGKALHG
ncbi:MAG: relaxase/mobilization nuclease domain-containing protein [Leptospirales bacterium]